MTLTKDWLRRFAWPETLVTGHPLAIAHRGASDYAPENTLKSFQIAADLCAEMWELDVRLSADGVCVVAHDDNLTRVSRRGLRVSETSYKQIAELRLHENQHIPRLEDVIELAKATGCGLYIEIKSEGAGPLAWQILKAADFRFASLASFNVNWMRELRELGCDYPLGVMVPAGADPFDYLGELDVDIIHPCWRDASASPHELLTNELLQKFADHDQQVIIWHEDRATVLDALWKMPLLGICSNRPELLKPYRVDPHRPIDIVCHRGANSIAPENTLEASRICVDQGFQFIELDVRTSSDGEIVVIHDAELERTTNGSGLVIDHTLAQLKKLDAGRWFSEGTQGYRIRTLKQHLRLVQGQAGLYVEVKQADAQAILDVVNAQDMLEHCFFWSSDISVLSALREHSRDINLMAPRWVFSSVAVAAAAYGAQIIEFDVERDDLSEISECESLGVKSMIYSRRSSWDELHSYLRYKPDMVNLDHPDRFKIIASYPKVRQHFVAMTQPQKHE